MSPPTQRSGAPPQHPASEETSRHHAADRHQGNGAVVHVPVSSLAAAAEDVELIAEVHGLVDRVVKLAGGHVLQLGSAESLLVNHIGLGEGSGSHVSAWSRRRVAARCGAGLLVSEGLSIQLR